MINMEYKIQKIAGSIFAFWAFLISMFHISLSVFRYVVDYRNYTSCLQWATVGFCVALLFYILVSLIISKESRIQIGKILKKYFSIEQIILIGLLLWFALSCYLNEYYGIFRPYLGFYQYLRMEDWFLFDAAVCFLILFPLARLMGREKAKKMIELIIHTVVVFYSVFTIICLWHVFHLEAVELPSGNQAGMTADVQLMLGYHNNTTGMIALTMLCLCVYMILTQEKAIKFVYTVFGLAQLMVVYLCNSRTVFLAALIFAVFIVFCKFRQYFGKESIVLNFGISFLIAAAVGVVFWFGRQGMFTLFEHVTHFQESLQEEANDLALPMNNTVQSLLITRARHEAFPTLLDVEGTKGLDGLRRITDVSSRFVIWSDCISLLLYSPFIFFFGVTLIEFPSAILLFPGHQYWRQPAHAHNAILQIGVTMGVPAMIMFVIFLILIALKCIKVMRTGKKDKLSYILPGILLCFIVVNMAEAYLVSYFSVMACFFFLFCGWVIALNEGK